MLRHIVFIKVRESASVLGQQGQSIVGLSNNGIIINKIHTDDNAGKKKKHAHGKKDKFAFNFFFGVFKINFWVYHIESMSFT